MLRGRDCRGSDGCGTMRGLIDVPPGTHTMKRSPLLARLSDRGAALATVGEWELPMDAAVSGSRLLTVAIEGGTIR